MSTPSTIFMPSLLTERLENMAYPSAFSMPVRPHVKGVSIVLVPRTVHAANFDEAFAMAGVILGGTLARNIHGPPSSFRYGEPHHFSQNQP